MSGTVCEPKARPTRHRASRTVTERQDRTEKAGFDEEALPHLDALYAYALRLTSGDEARAEDLVQDCLLNAYRSWHTYRPGSNCKAWLMTILHNTAMSLFRDQERRRSAVDLDEIGERTVFERVRSEDPEGRFFDRIVDAEVLKAIDALPMEYRETLVLSDLEGLSYAEIVEVVGSPIGTVKSRLFRARQKLQSELFEYATRMGYVNGSRNAA